MLMALLIACNIKYSIPFEIFLIRKVNLNLIKL